ncbi:hypothetical protein D3C87_1298000 [compost metagenome]
MRDVTTGVQIVAFHHEHARAASGTDSHVPADPCVGVAMEWNLNVSLGQYPAGNAGVVVLRVEETESVIVQRARDPHFVAGHRVDRSTTVQQAEFDEGLHRTPRSLRSNPMAITAMRPLTRHRTQVHKEQEDLQGIGHQ